MQFPSFLSSSDTILLVAPSFGCNIEPYRSCLNSAIQQFSDFGYKVSIGPNCYSGNGIGISDSPENCAKELVDYYALSQNGVMLSCGGGELMCETIGNVDFDKIKASNPRWFMGYSDNTNLGFLLTTLCDVASIYGPNAPAFGMKSWHPSIEDAWNLIQGKKSTFSSYDKWESEGLKSEENPLEPYNCTEDSLIKVYSPDTDSIISLAQFSEMGNSIDIEGRFTGGCLDCLQTICGTRFDNVKSYSLKYKSDGLIWFLESCDLNVFSMRRAMWQLDQAGWFEGIRALIMGRPMHFHEDMMGLDQYDAIFPIARKYKIPVVFDMDLGHLPPAMPMVNGSLGRLFSENNKIWTTFYFR